MIARAETLAEIVKKYDARKPAYYHPIYEELFSPLRAARLALLEIGIAAGNSLRAWCDYFPAARVHGIDLRIPPGEFPERVTMHEGDQSDIAFLRRVATAHGPFDVIIDDGSHKPDHWFASWRALAPHLAPGGYYVIEDLQAPRHAWDGWPPEEVENMRARLADLARPMLRQEPHNGIEWMKFHMHIFVARKIKQ